LNADGACANLSSNPATSVIDATTSLPELIYDGRSDLAEGPVWHDGALWWVNITAGTLNRLDPLTGLNTSRACGELLGCAVPTHDGHWILGRRDGLHRLEWNSGVCTPLIDPEPERPRNRLNDGKCDPFGNLWVGSLNMDGAPGQAALYRITPQLRCTTMRTPVSLSNGMAWNREARLYYFIDTPTRRVTLQSYDEAGDPTEEPRVLVEFAPDDGSPDGMTIDREGHLWIAFWGGGQVLRVDGRDGARLRRVALPVPNPTSCCFGGHGLDILFITSAAAGLPREARERAPHSGGIFALRTDTQGFATDLFGSDRSAIRS